MGGSENCQLGLSTNSCKQFYDELLKELKVIKYCNEGFKEGCQPKYKEYGGNSHCNLFKETVFKNSRSAVLADGSIIVMPYSNNTVFGVDVNGFKGPNKGGYDLFQFVKGVNAKYRGDITGNCVKLYDKNGISKIINIDKW